MTRVLIAVETPGDQWPEKGQMQDLLWSKLINLVQADPEVNLTVDLILPTMRTEKEPADVAMQIVTSPEVESILGRIEWDMEPQNVYNSEETLELISSANDLTLREFLEGLPSGCQSVMISTGNQRKC